MERTCICVRVCNLLCIKNIFVKKRCGAPFKAFSHIVFHYKWGFA